MVNLIFGDCIEKMKGLQDRSIDLVVTDPPYKTISGGDSNGKNSVRPKGILSGNRKLFKHQNGVLVEQWMPELYRILKDGSHCYIFTNSMNMREMLNAAYDSGFRLHNILVWEKNNCTPSQFYMKNCEYILFVRKGKAKWINNIGSSKTAHHFDNIIGSKQHPTEKPVDLMKFYIENSTNFGDIVLDPFMGSGSTGVACVETGRSFIGIELDSEYFQIAKRRIELIGDE